MAAEPFATHNGLVARAAERLVLVARGVDAKSLVVPEAGHLALRAGVRVEPARVSATADRAGVHAWLLYAAEAYTRRPRPARSRAETLTRTCERHPTRREIGCRR